MKNWLKLLMRNSAIQKGHFQLSSGYHSDTYIQCARILKYPWYAEDLGRGLAERIREVAKPDILVGPALGAILIAHETARALRVPSIFTERSGGMMALRRGFSIPRGTRAWIVEDVLTTGRSTGEVAELVRALGGDVVGCGAIVDRREDRSSLSWPVVALVEMTIPIFEPSDCEPCRRSIPIVQPGSRPRRTEDPTEGLQETESVTE